MLSRKGQTESAISLPSEWTEKVQQTLSEVYQAECEKHDKHFQIHGFTYPDEVILAVGFLDKEHKFLPTTFMASSDLNENEEPQKVLDLIVDNIGLFFDDYFAKDGQCEYISVWTEVKAKKQTFFYQVTRENVELSIKAEQLLNQ